MLRSCLHMLSGKVKGFARTKVLFAFGVFIVVAGILSFGPKSEVALNTESESIQNEVVFETVSAEVEPWPSEEISDENQLLIQEGTIENQAASYLGHTELRNFRIRPVFEEYEPVGVAVLWISDDSLLAKLGILSGDVIKSINGIPIKNMGDMTNAINSLIEESRSTAEIIRNNVLNRIIFVRDKGVTRRRLALTDNEKGKFGMRPRFEGDQVVSIQLYRISDDSILSVIGLQKNDIIRKFNSTKVSNVNVFIDAVYWEIGRSRVDVEILRNNEPMVVTYIVE